MYLTQEEQGNARRFSGFRKMRDGTLVEYTYFDRKKDDTIAFINGWGTVSFSEWARQVRIAGYNLLMHNSRGMGNSGLGQGDYMEMAAGDIRELLEEVEAKAVHLVGHSMGGLVGTLFIDRYKNGADVRTMTYVCSPDGDPVGSFGLRELIRFDLDRAIDSYSGGSLGDAAGLAEKSALAEGIAFLATRGIGVRIRRSEFSRLYHNFLTRREAIARSLSSMRANGEEVGAMMKDIGVPALIVAGKRDFVVEEQAARRIHERIPGSELVIFEDSSHAPMFEEPGRFNRLLADFLGRR